MTFDILTGPPDQPTNDAWKNFLTRADFPCHYVTPAFFTEPQFRTRHPFAVLIRDGSSVVAVATGLMDGRTAQCGLQSRPQLSFDPTADRAEIARTLSQALVHVHEHAACVHIVSWSPLPLLQANAFREHVFSGDAGIVLLDLKRGPDALFREFAKGRRANIRKAMRHDIEIIDDGSDADLESYYAIYLGWCQTKQQPPLPYPLFHETVRLRANRRLFLAKHKGIVIAGATVRFCPSGVMEYSANASLKEYQPLCPNDLLHWRIIEWACAEGLRTYSLGGAHFFLRRFGGTLVNTYQYRLDRTFGKRIEMRERLLAVARWSWKHLPVNLKTRIKPEADLGAAAD